VVKARKTEILSGPEGQRGGLEIVFNQQLTRLGITSLAASLPQVDVVGKITVRIYLIDNPDAILVFALSNGTHECAIDDQGFPYTIII